MLSATALMASGTILSRFSGYFRTLLIIAALLCALAAPAAALAQGAGDEQYQDPFGDEQSQEEPAPTATPAPAQPAQPAPSLQAPAPTATPVTPGPTASTTRSTPGTAASPTAS